jgi:hypothetical protein
LRWSQKGWPLATKELARYLLAEQPMGVLAEDSAAADLLVQLQAREPLVEQAVAQLLDQEAHAVAGLRVPSLSRLPLLPRYTGRVGLDKLILLHSKSVSDKIVLRETVNKLTGVGQHVPGQETPNNLQFRQ